MAIPALQLSSSVVDGLKLVIQKSPSLESLDLSQNSFLIGDIEKIMDAASLLRSLKVLNLSQNLKEGEILILP